MLTQEQKAKLTQLIEEYSEDKAHHYYIEDQGTTSRQVDEAKESLDRSKASLERYIDEITQ